MFLIVNWNGVAMIKLLGAFVGLASLSLSAPAQAESRPWFGTWALRDAGNKPETLIYSDAGGGAMRMVSVENRSVIVTRFDGQPAPDIGAGASGKTALAVKATSPMSYSWTFFKDGKPFVQGVNTLADDGKSFTEVSWLPAKRAETVTLVYERR
jgi:hypothetical protein